MESAKKILIVEDEKSISHPLSLKLTYSGYQVTVVTDGQAGLDALQVSPYDLVLLDVILPKLNGFAVLEELQKRGNKVPVIVASNLSQAEDIDKIRAMGAIDYYVKSNTSLEQIVERIQSILKKPGA